LAHCTEQLQTWTRTQCQIDSTREKALCRPLQITKSKPRKTNRSSDHIGSINDAKRAKQTKQHEQNYLKKKEKIFKPESAFPGMTRSSSPSITATNRSVVGSGPMRLPGNGRSSKYSMKDVFPVFDREIKQLFLFFFLFFLFSAFTNTVLTHEQHHRLGIKIRISQQRTGKLAKLVLFLKRTNVALPRRVNEKQQRKDNKSKKKKKKKKRKQKRKQNKLFFQQWFEKSKKGFLLGFFLPCRSSSSPRRRRASRWAPTL
jgi:hypothetical protein